MLTSPEILDKIEEHARQDVRRECCGLILESVDGAVFTMPCNNVAKDSTHEFQIKDSDIIFAETFGKIKAYYHSHPKTCKLSLHDKIISNQNKFPAVVYYCPINQFEVYYPSKDHKEYLFREFQLGKNDCFSLVRDFFLQEYGIVISDYPRVEKWFSKYPNLITDNFTKEGFDRAHIGSVKDFRVLQEADVILLNTIGNKYPVHMAVYLGSGLIMHHPRDQYSCIEKYSRVFQRMTKLVVRHKSLCF